jgi:hypothetical protein
MFDRWQRFALICINGREQPVGRQPASRRMRPSGEPGEGNFSSTWAM